MAKKDSKLKKKTWNKELQKKENLSLLLSLLSRLQLLVLLSLSPFLDKWSPINDIWEKENMRYS